MAGLWHILLSPMRLRPERMSWRRLGMRLRSRDDQERVERICQAVAGGFNAMICGRAEEEWVNYCAGVEEHYRPFAREGAATGYGLRHALGPGRGRFEEAMVRRHPEGTYMYYVGAGLWQAMRRGGGGGLERRVSGWDPMYRMLCFDGFGFKHGFFDYESKHRWAGRLSKLEGYGRHAAMQGVGRALWFRFMNDADRLVEEIEGFEEWARDDVAAGLGLASVFVHLDGLEPAWALALGMEEGRRRHFQLGMSFAFRARQMNGAEYLERCLSKLSVARREGVRAALAACDRIEGEVRSGGEPDGYRLWRERLTGWMEENLDYPLEARSAECTEAA